MTDKRDQGPSEDPVDPGGSGTGSAGTSAQEPVEGADDTPQQEPGSPAG